MSGQKKKSPWTLSIVLALTFAFILSSGAWAGKIKEYSADQFLIQKGKEQQAGTLRVSTDKIRMESTLPDQPAKMLIIVRQDKKLTWTIFPDKKKYIESALSEKDLKFPGAFAPGEMNIDTREESLGTETINGYKCEKKRIVSTMKMMGQKITSRSTVWISDQFDFPIRTENENGTVTELRNIKTGSQDDDFFELPSGYAKAADIMEIMGQGVGQEHPGRNLAPGGQGQLPKDMPEDIRKMIEEQMGKHPGR